LLNERRARLLELFANLGQMAEAEALASVLQQDWEEFFKRESTPQMATQAHFARFLLTRELVDRAAGRTEQADRDLNEVMDFLTAQISQAPELSLLRELLFMAVFRYAQQDQSLPADRVLALVPDFTDEENGDRSCNRASLAARQAAMKGELETAERYTAYLLGKGYYEPGFIRFCREQGLCPEQ
jgi:hypothetical protein